MKPQYSLLIIIGLVLLGCHTNKKSIFSEPKVVLETVDLVITQVSENTFIHTSFLDLKDHGKYPCNGMIVRHNNETIIFDTTVNDRTSEELIDWVKDTLNCKINAVIPTHFHEDNLGGLNAFDSHEIPSYALDKTIYLAKKNKVTAPKNAFENELELKVGNEKVMAKFFGEGHTVDNVVGYFPSEKILFGGCLVKALDAGQGNLADANVSAWSESVEKVKEAYPKVRIVIPGHGEFGDKELLDYTINLFKTEQ